MEGLLALVAFALLALLLGAIGIIVYLLVRGRRQAPELPQQTGLDPATVNHKIAAVRAEAATDAANAVATVQAAGEKALAEARLDAERRVAQVRLESEQALARALDERSQALQLTAQQQHIQWRDQELALVRQQQFDAAQAEAQTQLTAWRAEAEVAIRADAIERSRAVIAGKLTEHFIPYLPDFPFNPKDARFIGSPIDMVVFDGLDAGDLKRVVFVEVKTGVSGLTGRERRIRDAVDAGKIEFIEIRRSLEFTATVTAQPDGNAAVIVVEPSAG